MPIYESDTLDGRYLLVLETLVDYHAMVARVEGDDIIPVIESRYETLEEALEAIETYKCNASAVMDLIKEFDAETQSVATLVEPINSVGGIYGLDGSGGGHLAGMFVPAVEYEEYISDAPYCGWSEKLDEPIWVVDHEGMALVGDEQVWVVPVSKL